MSTQSVEESERIREQLKFAQGEVKQAQEESKDTGNPEINTEDAIGWLLRSEVALAKDNLPVASFCIMRGQNALVYARRASQARLILKLFALALLLFLFVLPIGLHRWICDNPELWDSHYLSVLLGLDEAVLPYSVFVWGFYGGLAYVMYDYGLAVRKRLFRAASMPWYLIHPFISGILACAVSLVILSGVAVVDALQAPGSEFAGAAVAMSQAEPKVADASSERNSGNLAAPTLSASQALGSTEGSDTQPPPTDQESQLCSLPKKPSDSMMILALVGFTVGFSTKSMWRLLDRTARRLLGDSSGADQSNEDLIQVVEKMTMPGS